MPSGGRFSEYSRLAHGMLEEGFHWGLLMSFHCGPMIVVTDGLVQVAVAVCGRVRDTISWHEE